MVHIQRADACLSGDIWIEPSELDGIPYEVSHCDEIVRLRDEKHAEAMAQRDKTAQKERLYTLFRMMQDFTGEIAKNDSLSNDSKKERMGRYILKISKDDVEAERLREYNAAYVSALETSYSKWTNSN